MVSCRRKLPNTGITRCVPREVTTVLCRRGTARSGRSSMERHQRNSFTIQSCLGERFASTAAASGERVPLRLIATKYYDDRGENVDCKNSPGKTIRFAWAFVENHCIAFTLRSACGCGRSWRCRNSERPRLD